MYNVSHKVDSLQCLKKRNKMISAKKAGKKKKKITAAHLVSEKQNVRSVT